MDCPYCESDSQVIDSRPSKSGIRRRRVCKVCARRFTTYERVAPVEVKVIKVGGRAEDFEREKLARSIRRAAGHLPAAAEADDIARRIEAALVDQRRAAVHSSELVRQVLDALGESDRRVAAERFAADYRDADGILRLDVPDAERQAVEQYQLFDDV
jgi:transcriptional repressor NrdR